jgi:hypothetical protein
MITCNELHGDTFLYCNQFDVLNKDILLTINIQVLVFLSDPLLSSLYILCA